MTFEQARDRMEAAGAEAGIAAASWYFDGNTSDETYRRVFVGLRDGDPEILDTLPSADLSGEWADGPTPRSIMFDVLGVDIRRNDHQADWTDELMDVYCEAFAAAAEEAIEERLASWQESKHES